MEKIFEAEDENGKLREGKVISPTAETIVGGQEVYNKEFRKSINNGALLSARFSKVLVEQGIWSDEKDKRITVLYLLIKKYENKLKNPDQTEEEAQAHACEIRKFRQELNELSEVQSSFSDQTAEGQADNMRYNYYLTQCILDKNTNKTYYHSIEDFIKRSDCDFALEGSKIFGYMLHGVDENYEEKLPEEIFFKRFGEPETNLTDTDKEIQNLLSEIVESSIEDELNIETIEYGKPKKITKKRGRPKKEAVKEAVKE